MPFLVEPADTGLLVRANAIRAKYSMGVARKSVWELGVCQLNRKVCPKYVHHLWANILREEGFTRL